MWGIQLLNYSSFYNKHVKLENVDHKLYFYESNLALPCLSQSISAFLLFALIFSFESLFLVMALSRSLTFLKYDYFLWLNNEQNNDLDTNHLTFKIVILSEVTSPISRPGVVSSFFFSWSRKARAELISLCWWFIDWLMKL